MRVLLNRFIPFDTATRWWYVLLTGPLAGLILGLVIDTDNFRRPKEICVVEGPPSTIQTACVYIPQEWTEDMFFSLLGFLIACGLVYLLEDMRGVRRHRGR